MFFRERNLRGKKTCLHPAFVKRAREKEGKGRWDLPREEREKKGESTRTRGDARSLQIRRGKQKREGESGGQISSSFFLGLRLVAHHCWVGEGVPSRPESSFPKEIDGGWEAGL